MALTLSGTNGVVGAGFTVDASGVSVTAGVGTFSSVQGSGANLTALPAANLTGTLPAISATNLTNLPAANLTGTLPAISGANLTGIAAGITMRDCWRNTSNFSGAANPLSSNLERDDSYSQGLIGSAMSVSSGYWTFPSTGYYLIEFHTMNYINGQSSRYVEDMIYVTTDNSSYNEAARGVSSIADSGSNVYCGTHTFYCFDVTDTSTHKVYFRHVPSNSSVTASGSSTTNFTYMTFTRLADT